MEEHVDLPVPVDEGQGRAQASRATKCAVHLRSCEFYCGDCHELVCTNCLLIGPHRDQATYQPHRAWRLRGARIARSRRSSTQRHFADEHSATESLEVSVDAELQAAASHLNRTSETEIHGDVEETGATAEYISETGATTEYISEGVRLDHCMSRSVQCAYPSQAVSTVTAHPQSVVSDIDQASSRRSVQPSTIPLKLHFIWIDSNDESVIAPTRPLHYRRMTELWQARNPSYSLWLWDGPACRHIVQQHRPDVLPLYDGYKKWVCRVDLVRWLILFVHGGVYIDADMLALQPIPSYFLHHQLVLLRDRTGSIQNCFAMAQPSYQAFDAIIGQMKMDADISDSPDVLASTGPHMLARIGLGAFAGVYIESDERLFLGLHWSEIGSGPGRGSETGRTSFGCNDEALLGSADTTGRQSPWTRSVQALNMKAAEVFAWHEPSTAAHFTKKRNVVSGSVYQGMQDVLSTAAIEAMVREAAAAGQPWASVYGGMQDVVSGSVYGGMQDVVSTAVIEAMVREAAAAGQPWGSVYGGMQDVAPSASCQRLADAGALFGSASSLMHGSANSLMPDVVSTSVYGRLQHLPTELRAALSNHQAVALHLWHNTWVGEQQQQQHSRDSAATVMCNLTRPNSSTSYCRYVVPCARRVLIGVQLRPFAYNIEAPAQDYNIEAQQVPDYEQTVELKLSGSSTVVEILSQALDQLCSNSVLRTTLDNCNGRRTLAFVYNETSITSSLFETPAPALFLYSFPRCPTTDVPLYRFRAALCSTKHDGAMAPDFWRLKRT